MGNISWDDTLDELLSLVENEMQQSEPAPVNEKKLAWLRWMHQKGLFGGAQDG